MPKEIVGVTLTKMLQMLASEAARLALTDDMFKRAEHAHIERRGLVKRSSSCLSDRDDLVFCPSITSEDLDRMVQVYAQFGEGHEIICGSEEFVHRQEMELGEYVSSIIPLCEKFARIFLMDELQDVFVHCQRHKHQPVHKFMKACGHREDCLFERQSKAVAV